MYLDFYGLEQPPFALTPDPRFVYLSERHQDALAHLLYGINTGGSGGFVQLTGEVGTGKTTLSRLLLDQLPAGTHVALILNPRLDPEALVAAICDELSVQRAGDELKQSVDALNRYLLTRHADDERVVVIIDEAQNLSVPALEQVRLLTNLETATDKLLQIILLGQPELKALLAKPDLRQLAQRITARYHLTALSERESIAYLRHRLAVAGAKAMPFSRAALALLHRRADGIPRLLNVYAERALLAGYAKQQKRLGVGLVGRAIDEASARSTSRTSLIVATAMVIALLVGAALWFQFEPSFTAGDEATTTEIGSTVSPETITPEPFPSRPSALAALAARWDGDLSANRCNRLIAPGWMCWQGNLPLSRLQSLNRPAVIEYNRGLWLLEAIGQREVRLKGSQGSLNVARSTMNETWRGNSTLIWQVDEAPPPALGLGDQGAGVARLSRLIAAIDPAAELDESTYNTAMAAWISEFQLANALQVDGIYGPRTELHLFAYLPTGPRLGR